MHKFLEIWDDWFYEKYHKKLKKRYWTFKIALGLFLQRDGKTIIETGCVRQKNDWGAGNSTIVFADFCKHYKKQLITVDNDFDKLSFAIRATVEFRDFVQAVHNDSVTFLKDYDKPIDFLYLDSLDCSPQEDGDPKPAQKHALQELNAAYPKFHDKSIILVDDNLFANGGKARLVKHELHKLGWTCILDYKQTLWIRG